MKHFGELINAHCWLNIDALDWGDWIIIKSLTRIYESRKQITQFYESIRFFNLIQEFRLPFTLLFKYWKSEEYCPYNDMNFVLGHCAATKASGNNFY